MTAVPARAVVSVAMLLVCAACLPALALDPRKPLTQYGRDVWQDGLPQSTVHAVVQTRDGYIWLGTYEGLVRFNGVAFTVFDKSNTPELRAKGVRALCEDRDGNLWVGTLSGGLTRYARGVFTTFTTESGLPNDFVYALHQDSAGRLWIGTDGGLCRYEDGRFTSLTTSDGLSRNNVRAVCEDREGAIWVGTDGGGLNRIRDGRIETFATAHPTVNALALDRDGTLWIGTNGGGLGAYRDGAFTTYAAADGLAHGRVYSLYFDRAGTLWAGTDGGGLYRFRDGAFARYSTAEGLSQDFVRSLCEDHEGSLWVGTNGGLNRLKDGKFVSYTVQQGLSQDNVRVVLEDPQGTIWIGTDGGGLNALRPDGRVDVITTRQGLPNDFIRSLCAASDGAIWVGTNGGGAARYAGGGFTRYSTANGLANDEVRALLEDRDGAIWMGTAGGGLSRVAAGKVTTLTRAQGLPHNDVRALYQDREGAIWIGTYGGGVARLRDGAMTTFTTADGLSNPAVLAIYQDAAGRMWFGTNSGGLSRLENGAFTTYGTEDGLFDDTIFQILEDASGNLWFGCNKGIFRVPLAELNAFAAGGVSSVTSTSYGKADGMGSNQCNGASQPAGWRGRDGRLWFPTAGGVAMIDPASITLNAIPPPTVIATVVVDGQPVDARGAREFDPSSERFEIHYDGLSFLVPDRVRFRYRLEGLSGDWIDAGTRRVAYYNNLPPGDYTFRVVACNNDGVWNEAGASFEFRIPTPPWRSWWALLLYGMAFVGFGYAGVQLRLRALHRRNDLLEARIAERTAEIGDKVRLLELSERRAHESELRAIELAEKAQEANRAKSVFLANMSHELRTPLNAILGFVQVMSRRPGRNGQDRENLATIMRSGEHLLGLINDVLSISKIEAGRLTLNERTFDLPNNLQGIAEMFRVRAEAKGLGFSCELSETLPRYVVGDESKLRQVLINLLGNAVKFTEWGRVTLRAGWRDGVASFEVEDTGPGLDADEIERCFEAFVQTPRAEKTGEGTGLGLTISREYVELMGGEIRVTSEKGAGSTFAFDVALAEATSRPASADRGRVVGLADGEPPRRLLVVDDLAENRAVLHELLEPFGFELRHAANGAEALDAWADWRPDLIFMDVRMPVMDGYEATREIRRREVARGPWSVIREEESSGHSPEPSSTDHGPRTTDHCRIVGLTASAFEHDREAILAAGCDDFVAKPFRDSEIFERLRELLGVRFVYENGAGRRAPSDPLPSETTRARIAAAPPAAVEQLRAAAARGSARRALEAVEEIRAHDAELADELAARLHDFAFDDILALIDGER